MVLALARLSSHIRIALMPDKRCLSSLEIDYPDGKCVDEKEEKREGNEHCNCGSCHPLFKSQDLLEELLHRPVKTRADYPGVHIAQL